ncbi:TIGR04282 family arsenosugar biosynthesis glycosyltransferase [Winogradskyella sp.]|uniref:TIGR04282 family arsenosugar biosynthesis glycosyltransferase n=1 Tax=Winogradskyella sp. TaxID=1883156 RepID=UPI003AA8EF6A
MTENLVIVFVKNTKLGSVKTRLAKTIGDFAALEVYKALLKVTQNAISGLDADTHIYFSKEIETNTWTKHKKQLQQGKDLGERMLNAFKDGFNSGYKNIILIGSDLPDISSFHIENGFKSLQKSNMVFGPAEDGGYYLVGMSNLVTDIFCNKPWSQPSLLEETLQELHSLNVSVSKLETLNDIDTYEDLIASDFYKNNQQLQEKIRQFHD